MVRLIRLFAWCFLFAIWSATASATPYTSATPNGIALPGAYPEAGGVAIVLVGTNGNIYYQFSDPAGAFRGFQSNGQPAAFRGNPFTINNPISLDCGNTACPTYFGGAIATMYVRFSAWDGDTQPGGFDENDISLIMNGTNIGSWSGITTEITNTAGTSSSGFTTGFGNNTFNTAWFTTTNAALLNNILTTGQITTQVYDQDPNDNYWDFRRGNSLPNPGIATVAPGYDLTKSANASNYTTPGQTIDYTFVVRNIGSVRIDSLSISDPLLSSVSCNKTTILDTPLNATPDQATCTGSYTITQADIDAGSLTNTAQATGVPEFGQLGTLSDSVTLTGPTRLPAATLTKAPQISRFGDAGTSVPYSFTLRNTGNVTLSNVQVADPKIPSLSCSYATLAPGDQRVCSGSYTVSQADVDAWILSGTTLSNTATLSATPPSGGTVSTTDSSNIAGPDAAPAMTLAKSVSPASFTALGTALNYTIRLTNTGNVTFPAAPTISDPLITGAGGSVTCPAGSIAPGAFIDCTASYTVTQADLDTGSVANTASATISVGGQTATADGSAVATASQSSAFTIDKSLAAGSPASFAAPGVGLTYEYVLTNTGNTTLSNPVVTDNRVAVSCPAGSLAPGASLTCSSATYATTQADLDAGGVTNTASATATIPGGGTVTSTGSDSVTVPAVQNPAMDMTKTAPVVAPGAFAPGLVVPYTYVVTNTGNVSLTAQIQVTDDKIGAPFNCGTPPLAVGASTTCSANYTVTAGDVANGLVQNNAFADDGTTTSNTATATIPQSGAPGLSLAKTSSTASFATLADTLNYTFTVTNSGNTVIVTPGQPITINDPKVTGITCAQPAVLSPGGTFDCTASYASITQAEMDAGQVVNTATASFTFNGPGGSSTVTSPSATATVPTSALPSMTLAKSAGVAQFNAVGEVVSYTFTVTNTGLQTLASVQVTDPLIPGLACTLTNIAPNGGTDSCTGSYTITQADFDTGTLTNTASASAVTPGGATTSATASETITVNPAVATSSMTLAKAATSPSYSAVGDVIDYTFAVTNTGTLSLNAIAITDPLIPSFSCTIASLAPTATDTSCTASYVVTQADIDAGSVVNTATASAPGAPDASGSETATGPAQTPGLSLVKTGPANFALVGQSLPFTFAVTNSGNVTLSNIVITDPLIPALSCTVASLAPGATDTSCAGAYVVQQADTDAGMLTNTATGNANAPAGPILPVTGSTTVAGPAENPQIQVSKVETDGTGTFGAVGTTETYDFTVTNTGNVTLSSVTISDPLTGFSCPIATLAPGAVATTCASSAALQSSVVITQAMVDAGTLSNTVTANAQSPAATAVTDSATVILTGPTRTLALTITKSALAPLPAFDAPGQVINYEYVVTNTGNVTITAPVTVTDDTIASVSCPVTPAAGIAPGASLTCTASHAVTQADIDAGGVTNIADISISQTLPGDAAPTTASATDSETVSATQLPALTLAKSIQAGTPSGYANVGDTLTYDFLVTNSGNTTVTDAIDINDPRLGAPFTCLSGPLAPGASGICSASYTITQADLDAGSITNSATAFTGPVGSPTLQSPADTASAFAVQSPSLDVVKSTPQNMAADFFLGNTISYAYAITNTGNVTIAGPIAINDNRIASVSCPAGSVAPGATLTCTGSYTITTNDIALGTVSNNAAAVATFGGNPVPSTTGSVTIPAGSAPALSVVKSETTGAPLSAAGQVLNYQYVVTNTGNAAFASDVEIYDDKIAGPILCHNSAGGTVPFNTQASAIVPFTATCNAPYTVTQADMDAGFVTNTAYAQSIFAPASPSPLSVQSPSQSVTVAAAASPSLSSVKAVTAGNNPAAAGDVLSYAITTTNNGNQTISVITVADPLIPSLSCTIAGNPAPANIILAPQAPNNQLICAGTYTVTQADIDAQTLSNTASIDGVSPNGTPVTGTAMTTHPLATPAPALSVAKTVVAPTTSPVFTGPGETITYGVSVTNTGNVTLNSTTITDPLDPGTTCVVGALAPGAADSTCQFTYTTRQADVDAGSVLNVATAVSLPANPGAPTITNTGSTTATGPAQSVSFVLGKSASVANITAAGQVVSYTYVVTNASNVTVRGTPSVTDNKIGTFNCGSGPLAPGDTTSCTATYTVLLSDMNAGVLTNVATASAPAVPASGATPASPAVPASAPATVTLPALINPALSVTKSLVSETVLFPTIIQATFAIDVANTGNITLTNLDIADDLTAFVAPGTLLSATYPAVTRVSGFATATANAGYDGVATTSLLAAAAMMNPGETGRIEIDVTYSTATGYPAGLNTATASSPDLLAPVSSSAATQSIDSDGDGILDSAESCAADRDGDGICDALDYDPTGYFYCEDTGLILAGGSISVTGPAGTQTGVGTSNNITILRDGSTGQYQFFVTAAGQYTLTPTYPGAGVASSTRIPSSVAVDVTSLGANPAVLGSTEFGTSGSLADFSAAANTPSYLVFDIDPGDPMIIGNNLALSNCAGAPLVTSTKSASSPNARRGDTVSHSLTFTNSTGFAGTGVTLVDQLPTGMVYTPGTATLNNVATEPTIRGNRLEWTGLTLSPGTTITVTLSVRITGRGTGGTLTNRAWLESPGTGIVSNVAQATITVEAEPVFDCTDIIGKVFEDTNQNGYPDPGEPGIAAAQVVTLQGVRITADQYGRFNIPCAAIPGDIGANLTLKLDPASLPTGFRLTTENPRSIRVTAGKLAKLNFGASLGRVVDLHLTAAAFQTGTDQPGPGVAQGLAQIVTHLRQEPSVLRLSYLSQGESPALMRQRLDQIERRIMEIWSREGRYKLSIERTIKEVK